MAKTTYRITDSAGTYAQVEGAEERDRWLPLGWSVTDAEPGDGDWVWLKHAEHGGRQRFAAGAVPLWQPKGWEPSDPPPIEDPFNAPRSADAPSIESAPASTGKSTSASKEK